MPRIAFIVSRFPKLTETFIVQELLELQRLGIEVEVYPLLRERALVNDPDLEKLAPCTHFTPYFSLRMLRAHVNVLTRGPARYGRALLESLGGTWGSKNFFAGALAFFPKALALAEQMEAAGVTHIHAQFATHPALVGLIIHRLTGIPFSFTARGSDIHLEQRMLREKIEAAEFAITVSEFNKRFMLRHAGEHLASKIHVVYGGVNVDLMAGPLQPTSDPVLRILCVGRIEEVKGQVHLVEACKLLRDRGVRFECKLIGEGPMRGEVERKLTRFHLEDCIHLLGFCRYEEVIRTMQQSDVVVLPTAPTSKGQCEGIPNVLKEAMACGVPVVSSNVSGIPELVQHQLSGLLLPPGDAPALADALQFLADNPAVRLAMGAAGRQKIARDFNLKMSTLRRATLFTGGAQTAPCDVPAGAQAA